jgi:hypothetical protein
VEAFDRLGHDQRLGWRFALGQAYHALAMYREMTMPVWLAKAEAGMAALR